MNTQYIHCASSEQAPSSMALVRVAKVKERLAKRLESEWNGAEQREKGINGYQMKRCK